MKGILIFTILLLSLSNSAFARDIKYKNHEVNIYVTANEPTQVKFPGLIQGGFKKNQSSLHLDRKDEDLIVFASEGLRETGEAIIVRLKDGRSFSIRIKPTEEDQNRDAIVEILDEKKDFTSEEEKKPWKERNNSYAPTTTVSGFMRDLVLAAEFGKAGVQGYRKSSRYKGETVLSDGTMVATIDEIYIGSNYWGYVISASNLLDQGQKLNPASFRIDGTRAISATNWELSPRPINVEQQITNKHKTKVYVITKAKKY